MNKEQISEKDIKKVSGGANTKKSESDNSESSREEICRKCGKTFLVADALACSFTSGEKIWNGQMENAGAGGQIPKMNDIFAIMIKNGGNRFMRMENYSKC